MPPLVQFSNPAALVRVVTAKAVPSDVRLNVTRFIELKYQWLSIAPPPIVIRVGEMPFTPHTLPANPLLYWGP